MPPNGSMQLLAASGEPFYCKIRDRHTPTYQTCFLHPAKLQWALSRPMKYWSWQESGESSNLGFSFVRDSFPKVGKLLFPTFGRHRGAIFRHNRLLRTPLLRFWNFRQHTILRWWTAVPTARPDWLHAANSIIFHFLNRAFVSPCQKTARCNLWHVQGSHFTAQFEIGTPSPPAFCFLVRVQPAGNDINTTGGTVCRVHWAAQCNLDLCDQAFAATRRNSAQCNLRLAQGGHLSAKSAIGPPIPHIPLSLSPS